MLLATLEIIADQGVKAVTHRAVADRSRVSLATTTYYFGSIQDLVVEALQRGVELRIALLSELAASTIRTARGEGMDRTFIRAVLSRPRADILAQQELYLEAARNPELRSAAAAAIEAFEALAARTVKLFGGPEPRPTALALAALVDGFALHRMVRPLPSAEEDEVFTAAVRALLIAHVAEPDEIAQWQSQLHDRLRRSTSESDTLADAIPPRSDSTEQTPTTK